MRTPLEPAGPTLVDFHMWRAKRDCCRLVVCGIIKGIVQHFGKMLRDTREDLHHSHAFMVNMKL